MGAIAGLFHPATPKPVDPARLRAMAAAMAHRGPDGAGEWTAPGVGFAHRRLAVLGGAGAAQPVATADLRYALVLDGTILNHRALRAELRAAGHDVRGEGDAEMLLQGFAAWGPSLLARLEGAFAFAVHDAATQTLLLARDRIGAKPLHYVTLADGALAFASELKGLLAHPLLRRAPDARAVDDFLALGFVPDDACVMAGVCKLPAAHFLLIERGGVSRPPRRWWQMRGDGAARADDLLGHMRTTIAEAARDTTPTALLSADVADAAIVALLAESSGKAVRTVSVTASDHAAAVARRFVTAHLGRSVADDELRAAVPALVAAFDEPFGDPAALTAMAAARLVREHGAVMLAGSGAARLLNGAARYRGFAMRERWRRMPWLPGIARTLLGEPAHDHARAAGVLHPALFNAHGRRVLGDHRPRERYGAAMRAAPAGDPLDAAHHADLAVALPAHDLTLADRAGMAAGVEWRAPLADHRLVAFAAGLPRAVRAGAASPIGAALSRYLPAMPAAPDPPVPVSLWLRGPLADDVGQLARSRLFDELGWLDRDRIAQLADAHRGGQADHGVMLWRLLMLERSLSRLFG